MSATVHFTNKLQPKQNIDRRYNKLGKAVEICSKNSYVL